ncbi:phosphopantetheine-binding protein [Streptomyces sp. NBC_00249]|uniref:acyl carrier protein n=1 Tax=Streptomyces sp. NBC_00249 TaxID=2975690 RepID=UPI00225964CB|nr:phosphopantetheine-binding protein [Streptomyces sp. NBC_00249]MCX5195920.1 phosphopantetheine-binding protein [Streptomyces sp. NBC_00249]
MNRQLDASLLRKCPDVLGASLREDPELTVYISTRGDRSGVDVRAAFRSCYGVDVRRVRFVRGLLWPAEGWCDYRPDSDGVSPASQAEYVYVPPSDPLEKALVEFWEELLEIRGLGVSDSFWECGGDSLGVVETIVFLDREYGVPLNFFEIGDSFTVARLVTLIRERSPR